MRKALLLLLILSSYCHADEARVEQLLSQMTLKEKIDYIGGHNYFFIRGIPRLKIPEIKIADGTVGVRNYGLSTSYPSGINIASSWNRELAHEVGKMMGLDARARGVHILLAPGVNLYRSPLCGRNFEYLGEDPHLTSRMAVEMITGIQSQNVVACVKHFVANNQEWNRHEVSSDVDEKTLRELYLASFEAAVKEANVGCVMASYNRVNGVQMSQNGLLNVDLLKNEWGFKGILVSDWSSTYDGVAAANNGLDLEMPKAEFMNRETLFAAIQNGKVSMATLDDKVRRILRVLDAYGFLDTMQTAYKDSLFNHKAHIVSRKMAEESIVLLKNDNILPLKSAKVGSIAVIGPLAMKPVPHGSGSSETTPDLLQTYIGAISDMCDDSTRILHASGVPEFSCPQCRTSLEESNIGFVGEYFDNCEFKGPPALTRTDRAIQFQFKERSYREGGPTNHYSVRWTGYFTPELSGDHTFYIQAADSCRLYLNDVVLIDNPNISFEHKTATLQEGKPYKVCVEYVVRHGPQGIGFGIAHGQNRAHERAQEAAASCEVAIVCVGFDVEHEGEDWDRSFTLPYAQSELIQHVASVNPNTIVVVSSGGNIDMTGWVDKSKALLMAWYPGQEGAKALARILFGEVSPSAKLPISLEKRLQDGACYSSYHDKDNCKRVSYSEGLFLGYRHFDRSGIEPLFPFGFGLSYTTFRYANLAATNKEVSFDITNTGPMAASEVAQVYMSTSDPMRPKKELKGFTKVFLQPNETKRVTLPLSPYRYYDNGWKTFNGPIELLIGSSSKDIRLTAQI